MKLNFTFDKFLQNILIVGLFIITVHMLLSNRIVKEKTEELKERFKNRGRGGRGRGY